jgi:hypothetical protein
LRAGGILLKSEIDESYILLRLAEPGQVDIMLMKPHEVIKDEIGIRLDPQYIVQLIFMQILYNHQELITNHDSPIGF